MNRKWCLRLGLVAGLAGVFASANATLVFAPDWTTGSILKFEAETGEYKGAIAAGFVGNSALGCAMNPYDGFLYVGVQTGGVGAIQRFDPYTGAYAGSFGSGFVNWPDGMSFGDATHMYVGDLRNDGSGLMFRFNPTTGEYLGTFGGGFIQGAGYGVTCDLGTDGTIYVTGPNNGGIQKFNPLTGEYKGVYASGFLVGARGVTMTSAGTLIIGSLGTGSEYRFRASDGAYQGIFANGFIPQGRGQCLLPNGQLLARAHNSSGQEYVCRFVPETGEYKGLFGVGIMQNGYTLAAETPARVCGNVQLGDWILTMDRPITVEFVDPTTFAVVDTQTTTTAANGDFCVTTYKRGTYHVLVKASHWLRKQRSNVVISRSGATGLNYLLLNGDADNDNEVGPGDFGALSSGYGSVFGDLNYDPEADFDGDGEIGPSDFGILSTNYSLTGD